MGTKTISISDRAYNMLNSLKRGNESFSDVIERLVKRTSISNFSGILSKEAAEEIEENIKELNRKMTMEMRGF